MSMKHLEKYIEGKNWVRRMFKDPEIDANNLSVQDIKNLLDSIDGDLSPENLTCDGELRGAKLKAKHTMLLGAQKQLNKMLETA